MMTLRFHGATASAISVSSASSWLPLETDLAGGNIRSASFIGTFPAISIGTTYSVAFGVPSANTNQGRVLVLHFTADSTTQHSKTIIASGQSGLSALPAAGKFGASVIPAGDWDQDGVKDILVGAPRAGGTQGHVYILFMNADATVRQQSHILARRSGLSSPNELFGAALTLLPDLNGDGVSELAAGAPREGANDEGAVAIAFTTREFAPISWSVLKTSASPFTGGNQLPVNAHFGESVAFIGDVNNDNLPDIAVGSPGSASGGNVYIITLRADASGIEGVALSSLLVSIQADQGMGRSIIPLMGRGRDGVVSLLVGADNSGGATTGAGAVFHVGLSGPGPSSFTASVQTITAATDSQLIAASVPTAAASQFGGALADLGDVDGSGTSFVLSIVPNFEQTLGTPSGMSVVMKMTADADTFVSKCPAALDFLELVRQHHQPTSFGLCEREYSMRRRIVIPAADFGLAGQGGKFGSSCAYLGPNTAANSTFMLALGGEDIDTPSVDMGSIQVWSVTAGTDEPRTAIDLDKDGVLSSNWAFLVSSAEFGRSVTSLGQFVGAAGTIDILIGLPGFSSTGAFVMAFTTNGGTEYQMLSGITTYGTASVPSTTPAGFGTCSAVVQAPARTAVALKQRVILAGLPRYDGAATDIGGAVIFELHSNAVHMAGAAVPFPGRTRTLVPGHNGFNQPLQANDQAGTSVASLGDVNGDLMTDVALGVPGKDSVLVLFLFSDFTVKFTALIEHGSGLPVTAGSNFGFAVGQTGDLTGDGIPELLVGAPTSGQVFIISLQSNGSVAFAEKYALGGGHGASLAALPKGAFAQNGFAFASGDPTKNGNDGEFVFVETGFSQPRPLAPLCTAATHSLDTIAKCDQSISSSVALSSGDSALKNILPIANVSRQNQFGRHIAPVVRVEGNKHTMIVAVSDAGFEHGGSETGRVVFLKIDTADRFRIETLAATGLTVNGFAGVKQNMAAGGLVYIGAFMNGHGVAFTADGRVLIALLQNSMLAPTLFDLLGCVNGDAGLAARAAASHQWPTALAAIGHAGTSSIILCVGGRQTTTNGFISNVRILTNGRSDTVSYITEADATVSAGLGFGESLSSIGDVDGNGYGDLAAGLPLLNSNGGGIVIMLLSAAAKVFAASSISSASAPLTSSDLINADSFFGSFISPAGDVDGNGVPDLLVNNVAFRGAAAELGLGHPALLMLNQAGSVIDVASLGGTNRQLIPSAASGTRFGESVVSLGDADGDGYHEFLASAPGMSDRDSSSSNAQGFGAFFVLHSTIFHSSFYSASPSFDGCPGNNAALGAGSTCAVARSLHPTIIQDTRLLAKDASVTLSEEKLRSMEIVRKRPQGDSIFVIGAPDHASGAGQANILGLLPSLGITNSIPVDAGTAATGSSGRLGADTASLGNILGIGAAITAISAPNAKTIQFVDVDTPFLSGQLLPTTSFAGFSTAAGACPSTLSTGFGKSMVALGDLGGDGLTELAVGDPTSGTTPCLSERGAVFIFHLGSSGSNVVPKAFVFISHMKNGMGADVEENGKFGASIAAMGDLNGDFVPDMTVGAPEDSSGVSGGLSAGHGAIFICFMRPSGTVAEYVKHVPTMAGNVMPLAQPGTVNLNFGSSMIAVGGVLQGTQQLLVGATGFNSGAGAVGILSFASTPGHIAGTEVLTRASFGVPNSPDGTTLDGLGSELVDFGMIESNGMRLMVFGAKDSVRHGTVGAGVFALSATTIQLGAPKCAVALQLFGVGTRTGCDHFSSSTTFSKTSADGVFSSLANGGSFGLAAAVITRVGNAVRLAISAPQEADGVVRIVTFEDDSATPMVSQLVFSFPPAGTGLGSAIAGLGDIDGDGHDDLAISNAAANTVFVCFLVGTLVATTPVALTGADGYGSSLSTLGALLPANTLPVVVVGAPNRAFGGDFNRGAVDLLQLDALGNRVGTDFEILNDGTNFASASSNNYFGSSAAGMGDLDGNLVPDFAAVSVTTPGIASKLHLVFMASTPAVISVSEIVATDIPNELWTINPGVWAEHIALAGDLDGNGIADLIVTSKDTPTGPGYRNSGAVIALLLKEDFTPSGVTDSSAEEGGLSGLHTELQSVFRGPVLSLGATFNGTDRWLIASPYIDTPVANTGGFTVAVSAQAASLQRRRMGSGIAKGCVPSLSLLHSGQDPCRRSVLLKSVAAFTVASNFGSVDGDFSFWGHSMTVLGTSPSNPLVQWVAVSSSSPSQVYILNYRPSTGSFDGTAVLLNNLALATTSFGTNIAGIGDLNNDGIPDIAIGDVGFGSVNTGAVHIVFLGALAITLDIVTLSAATFASGVGAALSAPGAGLFGSGLASLGDVTGDGHCDIMVGRRTTLSASSRGLVFLALTPEGSPRLHTRIELGGVGGNTPPVSSTGASSQLGHTITGGGDMDGDGVPDAAVSDTVSSTIRTIFLLFMTRQGTVRDYLDVRPAGTAGKLALPTGVSGFGQGMAIAPDMNADGFPDLLVTAPLTISHGLTGLLIAVYMSPTGVVGTEVVHKLSLPTFNAGLEDAVVPLHRSATNSLAILYAGGPGNALNVGDSNRVVQSSGSEANPVHALNNIAGQQRNAVGLYNFTGASTYTIASGTASAQFGSSLATLEQGPAADVRLAVGAPGDKSVYIVILNADTGSQLQAYTVSYGAVPGFGSSVASIGDINLDGTVDIIIGSPLENSNRGAVYVAFLPGNDGSSVLSIVRNGANDAGSLLSGHVQLDTANVYLGSSVALIDGSSNSASCQALVAIGAPTGAAFPGGFVLARIDSDGDVAKFTYTTNGEGGIPIFGPGSFPTAAGVGSALVGTGDMDGDGVPDMVVGGPLLANPPHFNDGCLVLVFLTAADTVSRIKVIRRGVSPGFGFYPLPFSAKCGTSLALLSREDGIVRLAMGCPETDHTNLVGAVAIVALNTTKEEADVDDVLVGRLLAVDPSADFQRGLALASFGDQQATRSTGLFVGARGTSSFSKGTVITGRLSLSASAHPAEFERRQSSQPSAASLCFPFVHSRHKLGVFNSGSTNLLSTAQDGDEFGAAVAVASFEQNTAQYDLVLGAPGADDVSAGFGDIAVADVTAGQPIMGDTFVQLTDSSVLDDVSAARFGQSVATLGDIDGDGLVDIAVGSQFSKGALSAVGAVFIYFGTPAGLYNAPVSLVDSALRPTGPPVDALNRFALSSNDRFGAALSALGDMDGNGVTELAASAPGHTSPACAFSASSCGLVLVLFLRHDGNIARTSAIDPAAFVPAVSPLASLGFGGSLAGIGDLNEDGTVDFAAGVPRLTAGGASNAGGVFVVFLDPSAEYKSHVLITAGISGFTGRLDGIGGTGTFGSEFGCSLGALGRQASTGNLLLAVGAERHRAGAGPADSFAPGAIWVLSLAENGQVAASTKISALSSQVGGITQGGVAFGSALAALGAGVAPGNFSILVGSRLDDEDGSTAGGTNLGAMYQVDTALKLNDLTACPFQLALLPPGSAACMLRPHVHSVQALTGQDVIGIDGQNTSTASFGGSSAVLSQHLPSSTSPGNLVLALGSPYELSGQGNFSGVVRFVHYAPATRTVTLRVQLTPQQMFVSGATSGSEFGFSLANVGDLDLNGHDDLAVGAPGFKAAGQQTGAAFIVRMSGAAVPLSSTQLSLPAAQPQSRTGQAAAALGDVSGDSITDLAIGAPNSSFLACSSCGAVFISVLNLDGSAQYSHTLGSEPGSLLPALQSGDEFGSSLLGIDEGVFKLLIIGMPGAGDNTGALMLVQLQRGSLHVAQATVVNSATAPLLAGMPSGGRFGHALAQLSVGTDRVIVGAPGNGSASQEGSFWVLGLNAAGAVSNATHYTPSIIVPSAFLRTGGDRMGSSLLSLGDSNLNGAVEVLVGAPGDFEQGVNSTLWALELDERTSASLGGCSAVFNAISSSAGCALPIISAASQANTAALAGQLSQALAASNPQVGRKLALLGHSASYPTEYAVAVGALGQPTADGGVWFIGVHRETRAITARGSLLPGAAALPTSWQFDGAVASIGRLSDAGTFHMVFGQASRSANAGMLLMCAIASDYSAACTDQLAHGLSAGGTLLSMPNTQLFATAAVGLSEVFSQGGVIVASGGPGGTSPLLVLFEINQDGVTRKFQLHAMGTGGMPAYTAADGFASSFAALPSDGADALPDLAIGVPGAGSHGEIVLAFPRVDLNMAHAPLVISGAVAGIAHPLATVALFGSSLAALSGVGPQADLLVGMAGDWASIQDEGAAILLDMTAGGVAAGKLSSEALVSGLSFALNGKFGQAMLSLGDMDGDGFEDVMISASQQQGVVAQEGALFLLKLRRPSPPRSCPPMLRQLPGAEGLCNLDIAELSYREETSTTLSALATAVSVGATARLGSSIAYGGIWPGSNDAYVTLVGVPRHVDGVDIVGGVIIAVVRAGENSVYASYLATRSAQLPLSTGDEFGASIAPWGASAATPLQHLIVGAPGAAGSAGQVWSVQLSSNGQSVAQASTFTGTFASTLLSGDRFGSAVAPWVDNSGTGVASVLVGSPKNSGGGRVFVLQAARSGAVTVHNVLGAGITGMPALLPGDDFGAAVAAIGDQNGDALPDIAVGSPGVDGAFMDAGAVFILATAQDGSSSILLRVIRGSDSSFAPWNSRSSGFGTSVAGLADENGDSIGDLLIGAPMLQVGRTEAGGVWQVSNSTASLIAMRQLQSRADLPARSWLGGAVASFGRPSGFGPRIIAIGAPGDTSGTISGRFAFHVLGGDRQDNCPPALRNLPLGSGPCTGYQQHLTIGSTAEGAAVAAPIVAGDEFGTSISMLAGQPQLTHVQFAVGAPGSLVGGAVAAGSVHIFNTSLQPAAALATTHVGAIISGVTWVGAQSSLFAQARFGSSVAPLGDLVRNGNFNLAVGAPGHGISGAAFILAVSFNPLLVGTLAVFESASTDLPSSAASDPALPGSLFGASAAGIGDIAGEGRSVLAIGAPLGGSAAYVGCGMVFLFNLRADGSARGFMKLSGDTPQLASHLAVGDRLGSAVAAIGDIDSNGTPDVAIGASGDSQHAHLAGAVYAVRLAGSGSPAAAWSVLSITRIAANSGGFPPITTGYERLGSGITALSDMSGDGIADIFVGLTNSSEVAPLGGDGGFLSLNAAGTVFALQGLAARGVSTADMAQPGAQLGASAIELAIFPGEFPGTVVAAGAPFSVNSSGTRAGSVYMMLVRTPIQASLQSSSCPFQLSVLPPGSAGCDSLGAPSATPAPTVVPAPPTPLPSPTPSARPPQYPASFGRVVLQMQRNASSAATAVASDTVPTSIVFVNSGITGALGNTVVLTDSAVSGSVSLLSVVRVECVEMSLKAGGTHPWPPCVQPGAPSPWFNVDLTVQSITSQVLASLTVSLGPGSLARPVAGFSGKLPPMPSGYNAAAHGSSNLTYGTTAAQFHLAITVQGVVGLRSTVAVPFSVMDLSQGGMISPPPAPPSSSPLVAPSATNSPAAPSRSPSASPSAAPTQSVGASPIATPSSSPAPLPFLAAVPRSVATSWQWSSTTPASAREVQILAQSAPLLAWKVSATQATQQLPWLSVSPTSKTTMLGPGSTQEVITVQISDPGLQPGVYHGSVRIEVDRTVRYPGDGLPGRISSQDLLPVVVPVVVTVQAPAAVLLPAAIQVNLLPGDTRSSPLLLRNVGSSQLSWALRLHPSQSPVSWLAVCFSQTAGMQCLATAAFDASAHPLSQNATTLPLASGQLVGTLAVQATADLAVFTQAGIFTSGTFMSQLQLSTNEAGAANLRVLPVQMRATLLSVVPREITLELQPGSAAVGVLFLQSQTATADVTVAFISVPIFPAALEGSANWLQIVSSKPKHLLPANTGQAVASIRVQHGGAACHTSSPPSNLLCSTAGVLSTVLWLQLSAAVSPNSGLAPGSQEAQAIGAYAEHRPVLVTVRIVAGSISAADTKLHLPSLFLTSSAGGSTRSLPNTQGGVTNFTQVLYGAPGVTAVFQGAFIRSASIAAFNLRDGAAQRTIATRSLPVLGTLHQASSASPASQEVLSVQLAGLSGADVAMRLIPESQADIVLRPVHNGRALGVQREAALVAASLRTPTCRASQQRLSSDKMSCLCAPGFYEVVPLSATAAAKAVNGEPLLQCSVCPAGHIRADEQLGQLSCTRCSGTTVADLTHTKCLPCPPAGGVCVSGIFTPQNGYWCEDCANAEKLQASNPLVRQRQIGRLAAYVDANGQAILAARTAGTAPTPSRRLQISASMEISIAAILGAESILDEDTMMLSCSPSEVCLPQTNSSGVTCVEGHKGIMCGECMEGWARSSPDLLCVQCPDGALNIVRSVTSWVIVTGLVVFLALRQADGEAESTAQKTFLGLFRIFLAWGQIYGLLRSARLPPSTSLDSYMDFMSSVTTGVSLQSSSAQCALDLGLYERFYLSIFLPVAAVLLPFLVTWLHLGYQRCCGSGHGEKHQLKHRPKAIQTRKSPQQAPVAKVAAGGGVAAHGGLLDDSLHIVASDDTDSDTVITVQSGKGTGEAAHSLFTAQPAIHMSVVAGPDTAILTEERKSAASKTSAALKSKKSKALDNRFDAATRAVLILLLLLHFGVVEACLRMLDTLDIKIYGLELLRYDLRFGEMNPEFGTAQLIAYMGLLLWGVGIPLSGAVILFKRRHRLHLPHENRMFGGLFEGFKMPSLSMLPSGLPPALQRRHLAEQPNFWYWELLVVIPRKMLLSIIVVLVRQPYSQATLIAIVVTGTLVLHVAAQPYEQRLLNTVETISLSTLWMAAFGGLVLSGDNDLSGPASKFVQAFLLACNAFFVVALLFVVLHALYVALAENREAARSWLLDNLPTEEGSSRSPKMPSFGKWLCVFGWKRTLLGTAACLGCISTRRAAKLCGDRP